MRVYLSFRSRRPGSFGTSAVGRVAEWFTATWLRFTCGLFVVLFAVIIGFSNAPAGEKVRLIALSPIAAIFYWYALLFCLMICRFLGTAGMILANVLLVYLYVFSGLIVQPPPTIALRLTQR